MLPDGPEAPASGQHKQQQLPHGATETLSVTPSLAEACHPSYSQPAPPPVASVVSL